MLVSVEFSYAGFCGDGIAWCIPLVAIACMNLLWSQEERVCLGTRRISFDNHFLDCRYKLVFRDSCIVHGV